MEVIFPSFISMSNKPFAQMKARYDTSKIEPNKNIALKIEWTPTEIEERQRILAQYAVKIWKKD